MSACSISLVGIQYTGIYFQRYSQYILFSTVSGFHTTKYFRASHCARYCWYADYYLESISLEYAAVLPGFTLSPRRNWPSVVLAVLAAIRPPVLLQYSQYSQHEIKVLDTLSILGTFVAAPAAALTAPAAAAPLAPLL